MQACLSRPAQSTPQHATAAPHLPARRDAQPLGAGHAQAAQAAHLRQPAGGPGFLVELQGEGCQVGAGLRQHLFQLGQCKAQPRAGDAVGDVQRQRSVHSMRRGAPPQPVHKGAQAGQEERAGLGGGAQLGEEVAQQRGVVGQAVPAVAHQRQRALPAGLLEGGEETLSGSGGFWSAHRDSERAN